MNRKRRNRRKRIIIAYTARTIFALIILTMVVLMGCGCLYIYEHLFKDEAVEEQIDKEDTSKDEEATNSDDENNGQVQNVRTYEPDPDFQLPDASGITIVLDAGHGGTDGGTVGADEVIEKDINLAVSLKVGALLKGAGANVIMTRDTDEGLSLSDRTYIANQNTADLFVSLHCNYYEEDPTISGLECYYHPNSESSKEYAEKLISAATELDKIDVRSSLAQNYQVLRDTYNMPAILIEMGFLSNSTECQNLADENYQTVLAQTISECIVDLFKDDVDTTTTDTTDTVDADITTTDTTDTADTTTTAQ